VTDRPSADNVETPNKPPAKSRGSDCAATGEEISSIATVNNAMRAALGKDERDDSICENDNAAISNQVNATPRRAPRHRSQHGYGVDRPGGSRGQRK
jgi:hypothetical protein